MKGFGDRIFLTIEEHATYSRRMAVRFARKNMPPHNSICQVCNEKETEDNPLQAAHKIPFTKGILKFYLTPDWLDGPHNLIWAHKRVCNKSAELKDDEIGEYLKKKYGIVIK
jgi:hypothetical protein